jgi:hypothetical protein
MQEELKRLPFTEEPQPDENFVGYLLRLTQLNDYDTVSWILQMAHIRDYADASSSFSSDPSLDLLPLAQLAGVNCLKLSQLIYRPIRITANRKMGEYSVFGAPLAHYLIRRKHPKICPGCLREREYLRRVWDLAPVTACPLHKCLLLDECPSCGARISWSRRAISVCRCEFDWREHASAEVDDSELEVARQIHLLCKLPVGAIKADKLGANNPLYSLRLQPFISALIFVASQFAGGVARERQQQIIDTKGKFFATSRRNAETHELLNKSFKVFDNWPNNFFSFLNQRRSEKRRSEYSPGSGNYFSEYKSALFVQLAAPDFDFMRDAFKEYKRALRYENYVMGGNGMSDATPKTEGIRLSVEAGNSVITEQPKEEISNLHKTHVPGSEAKRTLKTTWTGLSRLIDSGNLKVIVGSRGRNRVVLIEKASLDDLKAKLEKALLLGEVKQILGISTERVQELIECGLLNPIHGPVVDGHGDWRFDRDEAVGLINRLDKLVRKNGKGDKGRVLDFKSALVKVRRAGVGAGTFLQAVLDSRIELCGRVKGKGLRGLLFRKKSVDDYAQSELKRLMGDALSLREVETLLGVTESAVYFLVKKGFLRAEKLERMPSLRPHVSKEEFDSFKETYVLSREIALKYDTAPTYIINLLSSQGVQSVSGPRAGVSHIHLFIRREVELLDLAALIAAEREDRGVVIISSKGKQIPFKSPSILNERQAATILGTDVEAVRQLAQRGILKTHKLLSPDGQNDGRYYFSRTTVQEYKNRAADLSGLITFVAAAKMFGLRPDNFDNKFVKTRRLMPTTTGGKRGNNLFRVGDVEELLKIERQTIVTPQAAIILGVHTSCIDKMVASGVLKPISGPKVDGFGKNLFLRSDVEKLRSERNTFQAEQIKVGKTSRFGKRAGPNTKPVLDTIGPRVDQIIKEWQKERPNQRISGQRLYQQLISEGYRLGMSSLYQYLQQKHPRAA